MRKIGWIEKSRAKSSISLITCHQNDDSLKTPPEYQRGFTAFLANEGSAQEELVIVVTNFLDDATTYSVNVKGVGSATVNIPAQGIQTLTLALKQ